MSNLIKILGFCALYFFSQGLFAGPINYRGYQKVTLIRTIDGSFSSSGAEQVGNYSNPEFGFFKTNNQNYFTVDFDVSTVPPFAQIVGVQLVMKPENSYRGTAGMYYNIIRSDLSWIQGTQQNYTVAPPEGEPSFLYARSPSVKWKNGFASLGTVVNFGKKPIVSDSTNYQYPYMIIDIDKNTAKDLLEGNAHGICVWGWDATANGWSQWFFYKGANPRGWTELWVFYDPTAVEDKTDTKTLSAISAFPNPFNCNTILRYNLPAHARVVMNVYSTEGKLVRSLVNAQQQPGTYAITWDGKDSRNISVHSGIYMLKASINEANYMKKLSVVK
ncbi:MAG: hypothetical protein A2268_06405 [Candidatus Raymondbacteria bacterium RifOxyA12_full_50_37]|uniref:FlgD/Vpr Ig-like domain-containing protein n=1 Tax=Candidatus Raymondbacteria bacterium RIFOXYD12_FULL_49_13 TaxID=1817890 RepID=A0A1F7FEQ3_UNCRA|nr:MAG: hypothetical protein A2350_21725 [Candidatus Raymondbacteria bacterium RifOxyB12_full_50_8]OGJ92159.1 MAG: hypothetical protein A2268_06405 [Candidatus Raymondbacteria bacterium RifOxyA12_full_50_37]OGJ94443.1 MAG: hypothetical protein A2248_15335 [Candidatus Raymondbacteria bacterium RIFOXYA2_FULL_49_16]OGJ99199.1 MAG: hypothetical protein A2453_07185 [Candidatus Raymondbacteria bacterium RIFOXYC2_FULL_50_21]OGK05123.1 MAG: hypothetical protein A2519_13425 [Candidatus Raymondbacteria b